MEENLIKEITETTIAAKNNTQQINEAKERLDKHDEKLDKLQEQNVAIVKLSTILDEMRADNKEQTEINKEITNTLSEIKNTIINTNGKIENLANTQAHTNEKLTEMDKRIETIDEKSKFDMLPLFIKSFVPILLTSGVVYLILELIKK